MEPLSCPFCGKMPEVCQWYVSCVNAECRVRPILKYADTRELAILAWNTRPAPQGQGEAGAATEGVRVWECHEGCCQLRDHMGVRHVRMRQDEEGDWLPWEQSLDTFRPERWRQLHGPELSAALGDEGVKS
jgi:hypothetical protein